MLKFQCIIQIQKAYLFAKKLSEYDDDDDDDHMFIPHADWAGPSFNNRNHHQFKRPETHGLALNSSFFWNKNLINFSKLNSRIVRRKIWPSHKIDGYTQDKFSVILKTIRFTTCFPRLPKNKLLVSYFKCQAAIKYCMRLFFKCYIQ